MKSALKIWNLTREVELAGCVEVADRPATRNKGLLGRDGLAPGEGLWIVPCQAVHTIGMRFSIDLVYLDRKKRVKKVRSNVRPWRVSGCLLAHSVLELVSGSVHKTQTMRGDYLEFRAADAEDGDAEKGECETARFGIVPNQTLPIPRPVNASSL